MISIDREHGYAKIVVEGEVTLATIEQVYQELTGHPDFREGLNLLWDATRADALNFDYASIKQAIGQFTKKLAFPGRASAFVVTSDLNYGMARMFEAYIEIDVPQNTRVFRDIDEAARWLKPLKRQTA